MPSSANNMRQLGFTECEIVHAQSSWEWQQDNAEQLKELLMALSEGRMSPVEYSHTVLGMWVAYWRI